MIEGFGHGDYVAEDLNLVEGESDEEDEDEDEAPEDLDDTEEDQK